MKLLVKLFFLSVLFFHSSLAQTTYSVSTFHSTPNDFKLLLQPNYAIAANDTNNEKILDLVYPSLLDSTIERKKQHHKIFGVGWLIHVFGGYNWRAVLIDKQKFVGTVVRNTKSSKEQYTEYDINFDLNFHLRKYLLCQFEAFDMQKKIGRQDYRRGDHLKDYSKPPFVRDTNNIDIRQYRLHCELTPANKFRSQLNEMFYPTLSDGRGLKEHPNFETEFPSMGFYGTSCLDCNHSCHPEIHPYEWAWWLKATAKDSSTDKAWLTGLFHESSNRMKGWSRNPMDGNISIPFAFNLSNSLHIKVEHLVYGEFRKEKLILPQTVFSSSENTSEIIISVNDSFKIPVEFSFSEKFSSNEIKYWFSNLNYDASQNILSGYLHFACSVNDLYTSRITFSSVKK